MQTLRERLQKFASRCDVIVLGGGVSGITTAIVLQSIGFKPLVVTEYVPEQKELQPWVPTDYAMASAYPHDLRVKNLDEITADSQEVFEMLCNKGQCGVSRYRMFELFETKPTVPLMLSQRMKFQLFEGQPEKLRRNIDPPMRRDLDYIWGWYFDTYFVDMPVYLPLLWELFASRGGQTLNERVHSPVELDGLGIPIVNCLGIGARSAFADKSDTIVMRGRQVLVEDAPMVIHDGLPVAYNYTPAATAFSRADGNPEYVHFFPRKDGWVLGQTREPGYVNDDGAWEGAAVAEREVLVGDTFIPTPIIDVNAELLSNWKALSFDGLELSGREGYRYYRDPHGSGVRLEVEETRESLFVHNYGHGGSGVTVSWGCALQCAQLLRNKVEPTHIARQTNTQSRLAWIFGQ